MTNFQVAQAARIVDGVVQGTGGEARIGSVVAHGPLVGALQGSAGDLGSAGIAATIRRAGFQAHDGYIFETLTARGGVLVSECAQRAAGGGRARRHVRVRRGQRVHRRVGRPRLSGRESLRGKRRGRLKGWSDAKRSRQAKMGGPASTGRVSREVGAAGTVPPPAGGAGSRQGWLGRLPAAASTPPSGDSPGQERFA